MADDNEQPEQVQVAAAAPRGRGKQPSMSPLATGLLYGAGATAAAGPAGVLLGLVAGIGTAIKQRSYMQKQKTYLANVDAEYSDAQDNIRSEMEIADPDEKRLLAVGKRMIDNGWERLGSGDESGRELWDKGNQIIMSVIQGDISQRKGEEAKMQDMQRGLISSSAQSLRNEYQQNLTAYSSSTESANKLLSLTAQKDFDPNKPFYKAALTGLLADSVNSFYKDTPSVAGELFAGTGNAMSGLGGRMGQVGSIAGDVVKTIGAVMNASDFEVSREDYNRVAMNVLKVAKEQTMQRMQRVDKQGMTLDAVSRKQGLVAPDYSFKDYITGGVDDLEMSEPQRYTPTYQSTPAPSATPPQRKSWTPPPMTRSRYAYERRVMQSRVRPTN